MSFELESCPLCEKQQLRPIYSARDRHYGIPGRYRIVRCDDCSLVFLNPLLSDQELSSLYPVDYYAYQDRFENEHRWKEIIKKVLGVRVGTRDPKFSTPGTLLDLGCGSGWFLRKMREAGWDVHGVEINAAAAELGRRRAGLDIFGGTLQEANFPSEFFDYVRSNHSFEHISCPGPTLDEIHRILRPGGKVLIGVPNVSGLNARLFRQYWWYLGAPVHPFSYSVKTLCRLLEAHSFEIETITYNSDYSGILGSVQIWLNRANGRKSTEGLWFSNPLLKVFCHWVAKGIDLFRLGDAIEVVARKGERTA